MSCFHPQRLFFTGSTVDGKQRTKVLPFDFKWIDEKGVAHKGDMPPDERGNNNSYLIPCGHCIGCRKDQAREWTARLMCEMKYHDSSYFVTLTYNDEHVPVVLDPYTGCVNGFQTLSKRDVQLFMKRLRKARPDDKLRFYLIGEYGPSTLRPHYHMILFGLHLLDWHLIPDGKSETGNQYYRCPELEAVWSDSIDHEPIGFVSIEPANEFTCKYVCNYVTKKLGAKSNELFLKNGMQPPFSLSSRKPGIGYQYVLDHQDKLNDYDSLLLSTESGSFKASVPRYFRKKLLDLDAGLDSLDRSDARSLRKFKKGCDKIEFMEAVNDKDYLSQLRDMEISSNERSGERNKI